MTNGLEQGVAKVAAQLLSDSEQRYILSNPHALLVLMDYHDMQQDQADSMGAECYGDDIRCKELKAIGRVIVADDPGIWTEEILRSFDVAAISPPKAEGAAPGAVSVPVATAWMWRGKMVNAFPHPPCTPEQWARKDHDGYWSGKGYSEAPLYRVPLPAAGAAGTAGKPSLGDGAERRVKAFIEKQRAALPAVTPED